MRIRPRGSRGFTLIELLIVVAIVGILASVSMAIYLHARVQGNEASAVATLGAINQAQFAFAQVCGNQRYAATLTGLGVPVPNTGDAFSSPDLAADPLVKTGYQFVLGGTAARCRPESCTGQPLLEHYAVTADPVHPGVSGRRFFATNVDRVIYADEASFAGNMPETGPPPHGSELKYAGHS